MWSSVMEVRPHQHIVQPAANENNILVFRPRFGNFQTIFFLTLYPSLMLFPNESEPVYVSVVPRSPCDQTRLMGSDKEKLQNTKMLSGSGRQSGSTLGHQVEGDGRDTSRCSLES